jgi:hypothetical protein
MLNTVSTQKRDQLRLWSCLIAINGLPVGCLHCIFLTVFISLQRPLALAAQVVTTHFTYICDKRLSLACAACMKLRSSNLTHNHNSLDTSGILSVIIKTSRR